jgi:hypothetical protein
MYWLQPDPALNNWWLHDGALTQNTWCITYDVTYIAYKNGTTISGPSSDPLNLTTVEIATSMENSKPEQLSVSGFSLSQNYPNPFRSNTTFKYQVGNENPQSGSQKQGIQVSLVIYNLSGQVVATLVNESKAPGNYEVEWNPSNLAPGVYFFSLQSGNFNDVKKFIRLQ